jgi:transposase
MMTQEEYMNVKALKAAGWTISQIAKHLGYHPSTISGWLKEGGPPPKRSVPVEELVVDEHWRGRVAALLAHNDELQATSIMRVLRAEGFDGSYQSLTRHLRDVRGPRQRSASVVTVPIETAPGEEFQFDWSDCNLWARRWGWDHELQCFGAVLCWSRIKCWWFSSSIERSHTFEGLVRFFEAVDGVAAVGRTDRMGCLGRSRGKAFIWHPPALEFARHYGFALKACDTADAARKGKIERPFRDLKGGFLPEMDLDPPADIAELNRRVGPWLATYVHAVAHRSTGVAPDLRLRAEAALLGPLPPMRFDTARREPRRVGRVPLVEWDGVFYSTSPQAAGQLVEARQAVGSVALELRLGGVLVAEHRVVAPGSDPQWLPEHRAAAEAIALGRHGRPLRAVPAEAETPPPRPELHLGEGDYDVEVPDLDLFESIGPHPDIDPADAEASTARTEGGSEGCGCFGGLA